MSPFRCRIPLVFTAAALLACGDSSSLPLEPLRPEGARFDLAPERATGFSIALEDARTRLLPAVAEQAGAQELGAVLDALALALSSRDAASLRRVLERGDETFRRLDASGEELAAAAVELDAVRLILNEARFLLDGPSAPAGR